MEMEYTEDELMQMESDLLGQMDEARWLNYADQAYRASTDFIDSSYRKQWERNYANWQGKHPSGSKYYTQAYKNRSRLFRPKTKGVIRKNEAALVNSLFSTLDVVSVDAVDQNNKAMQEAARIRAQEIGRASCRERV
jgi:hypothetical protein